MAVTECKTKPSFDSALKDAGSKAVIIDFTASWCGPCRMIGPKFVEMSSQYANVVCLKVDVDENSEVAEQCGISAMPTFQVFKDGSKVEEMVGASEGKLKEMFEKYN